MTDYSGVRGGGFFSTDGLLYANGAMMADRGFKAVASPPADAEMLYELVVAEHDHHHPERAGTWACYRTRANRLVAVRS